MKAGASLIVAARNHPPNLRDSWNREVRLACHDFSSYPETPSSRSHRALLASREIREQARFGVGPSTCRSLAVLVGLPRRPRLVDPAGIGSEHWCGFAEPNLNGRSNPLCVRKSLIADSSCQSAPTPSHRHPGESERAKKRRSRESSRAARAPTSWRPLGSSLPADRSPRSPH
jgi:hypothetical protein